MRWDFGAVYKEIRKSKGLSQSEVCGEELSRTSLTKIESGKVTPKYENMEFLLRQIDMSFEEFDYICHLYKPSPRGTILIETSKLLSMSGTVDVEELLHECQDYLRSYHDVPIQHIHDLLAVHLHVRKQGATNIDSKTQKLIEKFWKYLEKQDTWYMSDFRIFSSILFSFPIEHVHLMTDKVLLNIEKYKDYRDIAPYIQSVLTNLSTVYFYNNEFAKCKEITEKLLEIVKKSKQCDLLALCYVRMGLFLKDEDSVHKGLLLLELTGEDKALNTLTQEVDIYNKYQQDQKKD